ncbi:hypothetical protein Acsp06_47890 [Actinomycetospora sp. NBRC 106375]|uniref:hypothetical protein n=1 Tax=Actinomycetospora sp. NBRC 106375 TaxID=3032207 RepID=UPI0024A27DE9|nr:hypothetical protein [Actinomycetospora sp. NBRC 106375]GLZ48604.1 hypothetical protein Acsp06_47890 [Actinomycetospora sp. NBRC 106375]
MTRTRGAGRIATWAVAAVATVVVGGAIGGAVALASNSSSTPDGTQGPMVCGPTAAIAASGCARPVSVDGAGPVSGPDGGAGGPGGGVPGAGGGDAVVSGGSVAGGGSGPGGGAGQPATPGGHAEPVTGRYNYDGTILLSDGRVVGADGVERAPATALPAGAHRGPDGSIVLADGTVRNADGTPRTAIVIPPSTVSTPYGGDVAVPGFTINPDGTVTPANPDLRVVFNYDGTATLITPGGHVDVWREDGTFASRYDAKPGETVNDDGSITRADGTVANPDGATSREPVHLPGGVAVDPTHPHPAAPEHGTGTTTGTDPADPTDPADGTVVTEHGPTPDSDAGHHDHGTATGTDTGTSSDTGAGSGTTSGAGTGSSSGH